MVGVFENEVDENGNFGGKKMGVELSQKLFLISIYLLLQKFDRMFPKVLFTNPILDMVT
jgi:hypothetical protein